MQFSSWTEEQLLDALRKALACYKNDCIFLFVDGLDALQGDFHELVDTLAAAQSGSNIKTLVTSRPWSQLAIRLASVAFIRLEDLNSQDIEQYVKQRLRVFEISTTARSQLAVAVTRRVNNIFLWAVLVCNSLIRLFGRGDNETTMQTKLADPPTFEEEEFSKLWNGLLNTQ